MKNFFSKHNLPILIPCIFALIYASISLVNHYLFRTAALDLGLYSHTLYDYAHFRFNQSLLIEPLFRFRNQLGDHFDIMLMLLSPLYWIFGNSTLLIVQIASILSGGIGVYHFFKSKNETLAIWAMLHFYCLWGIYSALAFDYHSNVVGAMFVPWLLLFAKQKRFALACLFTLFVVFCKENLAFWMFFVWTGIAWENRKDFAFRNKSLGVALFSLLYFVVVLKVVMPALAPAGEKYIHFFFIGLGNNLQEVFLNLIKHPIDAFVLLFTDPANAEISKYIKLELHAFILLSGGFAFILRPRYLWMLLPVFAQKLYHDDFVKWGIYHHYSIEFVPILTIALFHWLVDASFSFKNRMAMATTLLALGLTLFSFGPRKSKWFDKRLANPLVLEHYQNNLEVQKVHAVLGKIPTNYKVSASTRLVPHLANRDFIYCYPFLGADIDLVILFKNPDTVYPCKSLSEYETELHNLRTNTGFEIGYEDADLLIFKKKGLLFSL